MADFRVRIKLDGDLANAFEAEFQDLADDARAAIEETAPELQTELRAQVRGAGLGNDVANAWRLALYQRKGISAVFGAALVYSRATRIVEAFSKSGTIRAKGGEWLVLPTAEAVQRGWSTDPKRNIGGANRAKNRKWSNLEAAISGQKGNLHFLLTGHGKAVILLGGSGQRGKRDGVVLFVLTRMVRRKGSLDIDGAGKRAEARLVARISQQSSGS